jgi:hypothetical protein
VGKSITSTFPPTPPSSRKIMAFPRIELGSLTQSSELVRDTGVVPKAYPPVFGCGARLVVSVLPLDKKTGVVLMNTVEFTR